MAPFRSVTYLNGLAADPEEECRRYGELLKGGVDIVCMGIGENGHIAFNDPAFAEFDDKKTVKIVELDPVCRMQQVHDGCFASLDQVPTHALTLTIPTLIPGRRHLLHGSCRFQGKRRESLRGRSGHGSLSRLYPPHLPGCKALS